ncbi:ubiquitin conjugation factor E4 A-like [Orbicella faveolata]|uniref:ubiquitin conjugation factor E4 A-like n=1 Tax=Orbicella faveolata TaxID=48498 RepID=UPI0009E2539A|nr:ubiquitin conjugation factor E4 A-like [Orbicella faveolata]
MEDRHSSQVSQNPFVALFPSVEKAEEYSTTHTQSITVSLKDAGNSDSKTGSGHAEVETLNDEKDRMWMVNDMLQRVFLITVDEDSDRVGKRQYGGLPKRCVYLRNTAGDRELPILQWINIDEAIMERLSMSHPRSHVMITGGARMTSLTAEIEAGEVAIIKYLASCYRRAFEECKKWKEKDSTLLEMAERAKTLALSYAGTCLLSPEMFPKGDTHKQLFQLMLTMQGDQVLAEFLDGLVQEHQRQDDLVSMFSPVLVMLAERSKDLSSLLQSEIRTYIDVLLFFAKHTGLAEILVSSRFWLPPKSPISAIQGHAFEKQTLLGFLLGLTSMSRDPSKPSEFFQRPTEQSHAEMQATMANLRTHLDSLSEKLHKVIMEIIKRSNLTKHQVLHWFGACLHGNITRKKMMAEFFATTQAQDGFFLNLSTLLLKICQPFMDPCSPKLLKINPQYCAVNVGVEGIAQEDTGLHVVGLDGETRLVVPPDEEPITLRGTPAFGFVTECFFMTHHCLSLGLWKVCEKYRKLMNELAQMQQVYQDAAAHGSEGVLVERLKVQFENSIIKQLSLKTHLLNPSLIELGLRFYIATASWLNQLALAGDSFDEMTSFKEVEIPLPTETPTGLLFVPEFIVENMADFIIFLRHFSEETLERAGSSLDHLVTFFIIYMGSPERVRNPHLRAKLAETLEALVPIQKSKNSAGLLSVSPVNMFNRQKAFLQHKVAPAYLPRALLQLFVDIEFTGHSMQFEQKFGYRHHMYSVLQFMWKEEKYRESLTKLGDEAADERRKMTTNVIPLFLRFLNLLINDSIFLLDEALQYMATLKKMQAEKDSGEWESLSDQAQQQMQQELQHTGGMARSNNILANETVHALSYMTAQVKRPFLIGCMLRRTADMLNYFLLRLVGPKMGELKVKNLSEFHFKPQQLVSDIIDMYLNLGEEESFCRAVATDKRSYSPNLFKQSERVLKLIGRPTSVIFRLSELASRIDELAQQEEEEEIPEPPDEFVDPITNMLMSDPVILTTSNNVVDKSTICRHLLSDQKDPFNRSPLTLEMVQPHTELKTKIQQWLASVKGQKRM